MSLPTNFHELVDQYGRLKPEFHGINVQFTEFAENNCEAYPERGMRGRLTDAKLTCQNEVVFLTFNFGIWQEHNLPLEKPDYYDRNSVPCLKASETSFFKPVDVVYFEMNELISLYFTQISE